MIPHSEQEGNPPGLDRFPTILRSAGTDLTSILTRVGTPERFRRGAAVLLGAVANGPLVVVTGRLSLVRMLLNGPSVPVDELLPGDILCPQALHPIVRANSFLRADEETIAYTVLPGQLTALRGHRPDLAAVLDCQVNDLLRRLLDETEALLRCLGGHPE